MLHGWPSALIPSWNVPVQEKNKNSLYSIILLNQAHLSSATLQIISFVEAEKVQKHFSVSHI